MYSKNPQQLTGLESPINDRNVSIYMLFTKFLHCYLPVCLDSLYICVSKQQRFPMLKKTLRQHLMRKVRSLTSKAQTILCFQVITALKVRVILFVRVNYEKGNHMHWSFHFPVRHSSRHGSYTVLISPFQQTSQKGKAALSWLRQQAVTLSLLQSSASVPRERN